MKKTLLLHHLGYADLFSNNGLVNFYAGDRENIKIIVDTQDKKEILEYMYGHIPQISCLIPNRSLLNNSKETFLICHTQNDFQKCPRTGKQCLFVDWSKHSFDEIIKVGSFNTYHSWENFRNDPTNISFSHSFYTYNQIPIENRIDSFSLNRNKQIEDEVFMNYVNFIDSDYSVIHDDPARNINIDPRHISSKNIYNLNGKSKLFLDQIGILENASELHFIDSSYSVLIYFLSFHSEKIKKIPKYLHLYTRTGRDISIYQNPTPENWFNVF